MRALYGIFKRGHLFKAAVAIFCVTVLLGGLAGCGKKGPPVAPPLAQTEIRIQGSVFVA